ncbi:FHA domain-containing protein [Ruania zhangjianzhongii]|uniref:FHA domain-containing protein n=1 Tax=Ruania zhangjianzhongii TaxID=2603206 RepID=UPI0011C9B329|nr:FHA domain-containing protein [Ruania zhangjianzhongii]
MLDLIGDDASGYLSAPAERSRWQDTWTMQRTRREAMALLARTYGSWTRTLCGALATAVLLGGAYLLGQGVAGLVDDGGLVAVALMVAAVLLLLAGLAGAGYVLFTGTRVVGALRAWSSARSRDGGPGLRLLFTPAVVVRLVLAVVLLAACVTLVLVRTGVLLAETEETAGGALWQWFAAAVAAGSALAALSGAVRTGLALRRRPGQTATGGWQQTPAQPAHGGPTGYAPTGQWAPQPVHDAPDPGVAGAEPGAFPDAAAGQGGGSAVVAPEEAEEEWAATRMVSDLQPAPVPLRVRLSDGQDVAADGLTLIGRSPAGRNGEQVSALLAVTDSAVSKTHLAVRMAEGRAWVTDRASTNGTLLVRDGAQQSLTPWQEASLAPGDRLLLGGMTLQVEPVDVQ